jgi:dihydropteroate synthase
VIWRCRDVTFDLTSRTLVMGILNVTPDSFSDGGLYFEPEAAIARGRELLAQGAVLLDLGAESTRPGAAAVPAAEQVRRLEPVLRALAGEPRAVLSVDTRSAEVAAAAIGMGAHAVNDVSGLGDPAMAAAVAPSGAGLVLMHMRGTPETMQTDLRYDDVVAEVAAHLRLRLAAAEAAGIAPERVALDPGIGFGKSAEQSLRLLARTDALAGIGRPLLVGASRKSFLARLLGDAPPDRRLEASLAAAVIASLLGARILRVHDVAETRRALQVTDAARAARRN